MALQQYFYDQQIRRFIVQFIRAVSNFQVEFGKDRNGAISLQRVPVIYGDSSRQVASILKQGSENYLNTVPAMAVYINGLTYDRERVQNPTFTSKMQLRERHYDPYTGDYSTQQGDTLTVERLMPVPYTLSLKLDIWTSNTEQKLQLVEQISSLFNPALEIQSTDNYIDWTSLSYVLLTDILWTNRAIPAGTDANPVDVATLTFSLPIWISSPSLVKKMGVIQKIIASVFNSENDLEDAIYNDARLLSRQYITPLQYSVMLIGNQLSLVRYNDPVVDSIESQVIKKISANVTSNTAITLSSTTDIQEGMRLSGTGIDANCTVIAINGDTITTNTNVTANVGDRISFTLYSYKTGVNENWRDLVNVYGNLTNGTSQIKLELDDGNEIVGTVAYHPSNDSVLLWTADMDTLPVNTLEPISAIIDPERSRPNNDLAAPAAGTRYLLVNDYIGAAGAQPTYNWQGIDGGALVAKANDIIQFNGSFWFVAFDNTQETSIQYVTNLTTNVQYKFSSGAWTKSYEGPYEAGKWELIL
jgi:hypothetical protein